jgi:hypothetical protein
MSVRWLPSHVTRFVESFSSSTQPLRVETDQGDAFLKVLGNPEGPHTLASEWVAFQLAQALGIRTFQAALITLDETDELLMKNKTRAQSGSAFATKAEQGKSWGGSSEELHLIRNKEDLTRLIVFDTWIRNRDRYAPPRQNPSNVFLSAEQTDGRSYELVVMDHTHCFGDTTQLSKNLGFINIIQDQRIFGNFPQFQPFFEDEVCEQTLEQIQALPRTRLEQIVMSVPTEWEVNEQISSSWILFLERRAIFLGQKSAKDFAP